VKRIPLKISAKEEAANAATLEEINQGKHMNERIRLNGIEKQFAKRTALVVYSDHGGLRPGDWKRDGVCHQRPCGPSIQTKQIQAGQFREPRNHVQARQQAPLGSEGRGMR
jgi:hypothetical protein